MQDKKPQVLVRWHKRSVVGPCTLSYTSTVEMQRPTEALLTYVYRQLFKGPTSIDYLTYGLKQDDNSSTQRILYRIRRSRSYGSKYTPKIKSDHNRKAKMTWYYLDRSDRIEITRCMTTEGYKENHVDKKQMLIDLLTAQPDLNNRALVGRGYSQTLVTKVRKEIGIRGTQTAYLKSSDFDHIPLPSMCWGLMGRGMKK